MSGSSLCCYLQIAPAVNGVGVTMANADPA